MSTRIAMSSLRFGRWKSIKPILASRGNFYQIFIIFLPAATKLGQGNIFTSVCLSTGGRGVCLSACWDIPPRPGTPRTRHHHPPGPGTTTTPLSRHHPSPPGADTPPPGSRLQHTVNERPVRILLECILVQQNFAVQSQQIDKTHQAKLINRQLIQVKHPNIFVI